MLECSLVCRCCDGAGQTTWMDLEILVRDRQMTLASSIEVHALFRTPFGKACLLTKWLDWSNFTRHSQCVLCVMRIRDAFFTDRAFFVELRSQLRLAGFDLHEPALNRLTRRLDKDHYRVQKTYSIHLQLNLAGRPLSLVVEHIDIKNTPVMEDTKWLRCLSIPRHRFSKFCFSIFRPHRSPSLSQSPHLCDVCTHAATCTIKNSLTRGRWEAPTRPTFVLER